MDMINIKDLSSDNLLKIIEIIIKDYEQKLDNMSKYYDEKISVYQELFDDKNNQISYLEEEINEIIKNIDLEKQLQNNHLT
tara:strand:+ start:193 stop:435 length:243 start_codon:yes stop_codon:yes gene_type:complete